MPFLLMDVFDHCPNIANPAQEDLGDGDGVGDGCDNCMTIPNGPLLGTCTWSGMQPCTTNTACIEGECIMNQRNNDHDGFGDVCDPDDDNDGVCDPGLPDPSCSGSDNCRLASNQNQADTYPPGGNNIGDTYECEGNFDGDTDCDGTDAATFKRDFGRSNFKNPCTNGNPCNGDLACDVDVDGSDAAIFKADFGRSAFKNPCPKCVTLPWCVYP